MPEHRVATQEEWQSERDELLKEEKELTRRGDELAAKRRELPWVAVEKDYLFETDGGTKRLAELFDGRSQLIVYHFMFGPTWTGGCPVCSSIADTLDPQVPHLEARDATLLLNSRAPLEKLRAYRTCRPPATRARARTRRRSTSRSSPTGTTSRRAATGQPTTTSRTGRSTARSRSPTGSGAASAAPRRCRSPS